MVCYRMCSLGLSLWAVNTGANILSMVAVPLLKTPACVTLSVYSSTCVPLSKCVVEFRRLVAGTLVPAEVAVVAPLRRLFDWLESASTHIADVDVVHIAGILNDEAHR